MILCDIDPYLFIKKCIEKVTLTNQSSVFDI